MGVKLNLGCGWNKKEGYINIDINPRWKPDLLHNILTGLPYSDSSVEEILAQDFLEHIPASDTIWAVEEIYRVLEPNGKFISHTPDAEFGQGAFADPTHINFWTEGRWLYFSHPMYRNLCGIEAEFTIEKMQRILTDPIGRVYHLIVHAKAIKGDLHV
jgi:predicted SAM-dependent methyltransferase